jgi:phosphoribosylformylglycinamidine synthase I
MTVGIVQFPGTLCDRDVRQWILKKDYEFEYISHDKRFSKFDFDSLIIPGGFSFGDYIRPGAMAKFSEVTKSIIEFADNGGKVLGICNGFQILCEMGLLPGQLLQNTQGHFICKQVVVNCFVSKKKYKFPIAHKFGNYFVNQKDFEFLMAHNQIWLTYEENVNGSIYNIAGVKNQFGNVCGLMPHPERAVNDWMGSEDGNCFYF